MRSRTPRGSAAVEFALVLPVLLLVVLAIAQVGLLARDQLLLTQAARAAAREAAVTSDGSAVRSAALEAAPALDAGILSVDIVWGATPGDPVEIALRYPAPLRVPFVDAVMPNSVELMANAAMRREFP